MIGVFVSDGGDAMTAKERAEKVWNERLNPPIQYLGTVFAIEQAIRAAILEEREAIAMECQVDDAEWIRKRPQP